MSGTFWANAMAWPSQGGVFLSPRWDASEVEVNHM